MTPGTEGGFFMGRGRKRGDGEKQHSPETWMRAWENRGLVFSVAQRYFSKIHDHEEYLIDGLKGLCLAIESYDPKRGKFSTYASRFIRSVMGRAIAESLSLIHVPAHIKESKDFRPHIFMRETEDWPLSEICSSSDECEMDRAATKSAELVNEALSDMPPRWREVICRRFGIGAGQYEEHPSEIAKSIGIRTSTESMIASRAMKRIRAYIEQKEGRATA